MLIIGVAALCWLNSEGLLARYVVNKAESSIQSKPDTVQTIDALIERLRTTDVPQSAEIKSKLIYLASQSSENRSAIVDRLLKIAGDLSLRDNPEDYGLWKNSVLILGELREESALAILVKCLDCNDGILNFKLDYFPASIAVRDIGPSAIPHLLKLIESKPEPRRLERYLAVLILNEIGGEKEEQFLRKQLSFEQDDRVVRVIKYVLSERKTRN